MCYNVDNKREGDVPSIGKETEPMKARKSLELTFHESFMATLFAWDNGYLFNSYKTEWTAADTLRIEVQRRTERQELRAKACYCYGATAKTLVR